VVPINNQHNSTGTGVGLHYKRSGILEQPNEETIFSSNTGYSVDVRVPTGLVEMDYNDLYTSGTNPWVKWSMLPIVADLLAWRIISQRMQKSLNVGPQYGFCYSDLNWHKVQANRPLDRICCCGFQLILMGIQEQLPVSIGANEFCYSGSGFEWKTIRSILPVVLYETSPPFANSFRSVDL